MLPPTPEGELEKATQQRIAAVVPPLKDYVCQIWWARPVDARPALDPLLKLAERDRRNRLVRKDDQDRLTVGAALTRLVLARHLRRPADQLRFDRTCCFCGAKHGKPQLVDEDGGLQFSVSHSGQRVAVAVVRGGIVGVDVEQESPDLEVDTLVPEVLSEEERVAFRQLAPRDRLRGLLTYWTRKEALLKATGDGLRVPMPTITVSGPDEPPLLRRWSGRLALPASVTLHALRPGSGHVASLAVLGLPTVRLHELDGQELLALVR
jgi:4'-phosphopantetheinyl transferase